MVDECKCHRNVHCYFFVVVDGTVHVILGCVPFGLLFLTSSHIEYRSNLLKVETHAHALAY